MAYLFDGTNDSLEITKAAGATDLSAVTYVFWLKRPSASGYRDVFWNGGSWSATYHSFIQYDTAGYMALVANWTSAEARWSIPTPDTAWHLHIVSYDFGSSTNDPTWYVDGVSQTITERVSPSGTADYAKDDGSLTIGSGDAGGFEYWSGEIAEFAMYNTILDASARSAIVTANGPSGHSTNRVYYSPMVTNFTDVDGGGSGTVNGATLSIHPFGTGLYAKTSVTTNSGTSTTPSATLPTGGAVGDVLIAIISHNDGTVTVADNNGATPMTEDYDSGNDAGGLGLAIYSRVMTGSEPATLNFTISASNRWAITSFILTGQNATLYDVAISTYDIRLTTTTHTTTGCTTNTDGAMALAIDTLDSGTNTFSAGPGGTWVQVAIVNTGQPLGVYYLKKATAGATGDASFTSASSGNSLAMRQFAIKAAADSIILQSIIANPVASLSS